MNSASNDEGEQVDQIAWFTERINGVSDNFRYTVFYAIARVSLQTPIS